MRIEVHYFADDDTEFDTEEECREYEEKLNRDMSSVAFFDEDMRRLTTLEDIEGYGVYMVIEDGERAKDLFPWLRQTISFEPPKKAVCTGDVLFWNEDGFRGDWENMVDKANAIFENITRLMKLAGV